MSFKYDVDIEFYNRRKPVIGNTFIPQHPEFWIWRHHQQKNEIASHIDKGWFKRTTSISTVYLGEGGVGWGQSNNYLSFEHHLQQAALVGLGQGQWEFAEPFYVYGRPIREELMIHMDNYCAPNYRPQKEGTSQEAPTNNTSKLTRSQRTETIYSFTETWQPWLSPPLSQDRQSPLGHPGSSQPMPVAIGGSL